MKQIQVVKVVVGVVQEGSLGKMVIGFGLGLGLGFGFGFDLELGCYLWEQWWKMGGWGFWLKVENEGVVVVQMEEESSMAQMVHEGFFYCC